MVKKTASIKKAIIKNKNTKKADKEAQKNTSAGRSRGKNVLQSGMKLYSNLAYKRRVKEDQRARRKA
jgi:hypothetical protein